MMILRDAVFAFAAFGLAIAFANWLTPSPRSCERIYIGNAMLLGEQCR
jgi:hypothetical protein